MGLLDWVIGGLQQQASAGAPPPDMPAEPRDMSIQGFPPGGPPMPRPRPPEAGPGMTSAPAMLPDGPPQDVTPQQPSGLLGALMGGGAPDGSGGAPSWLTPDLVRRATAGVGAGLAKVGEQPFAAQAFANSAGAGMQGIDKSDKENLEQKLHVADRGLKLKQINQLGSYRDDMADAKLAGVGIAQQNADTRGTVANNNLVLGKDRNGIRQQDADTRSSVAPSRIRKNNTGADLDEARTARARGEIDLTEPSSKRVQRADMTTDRYFKPRITALSEEKKRIQAMPGTPQQKQEAAAEVDRKAQELDAQYFELKSANRKAHGIGPNGEDLATKPGAVKSGAGRVAEGFDAAGKPAKKLGAGTRDDPHQPQSPEDFDAILPGQVFRDPGDGKLYQK